MKYKIAARWPTAHRFSVQLSFKAKDPQDILIALPAWIPGSYMIRDFAKHIVQIEAKTDKGQVLNCEKTDKSTWKIESTSDTIHVEYQVYAWDLSVRGAHLDDTHGFYNGASVFLYPIGMQQETCDIEICAPLNPTWKVATSLRPKHVDANGFGQYIADNYDELIDHPVEMGNFLLSSFEACGVVHRIAITGEPAADLVQITADLKRICETQIRFFGEPAPMDNYLFLVMALPKGAHGGLEHRASCALHCEREQLPFAHHNKRNEGYIDFLSLCSHEYFHTWWIKRVKPEAFYPYHLQSEQYTDLLWLFEGFTTYYQDLMLLRADLIDTQTYLNLLSHILTRITRSPGRFWQTAKQASFDAWIKLYKPDENFVNANVSYYSKGAMVACALDLWLRQKTDHQFTLDNLVQECWQTFGLMQKGLTQENFLTFLTRKVDHTASEFLQSLFDKTGDIPLEPLFENMGIKYQLRAMTSLLDKGGYLETLPEQKPQLGIQGQYFPDGVKVLVVYQDSPAEQAGIAAGDVLLSANEWRLDHTWEQQIARYSFGQVIVLHLFRRDNLLIREVKLKELPKNTVGLMTNHRHMNLKPWIL